MSKRYKNKKVTRQNNSKKVQILKKSLIFAFGVLTLFIIAFLSSLALAANTATDNYVWVASNNDGTVSRIDKATEEVTPITVGGSPAGIAVDNDSVWVGG